MNSQNKKAALELSIGTVVIVVLAMSMLVLGLILITTIFDTTTTSVKEIDSGVKNEINKLFSDNEERGLVLFPDSGIIKLEQGEDGSGFAISIRNLDGTNDHAYSYTVTADSPGSCPSDYENYIQISAGARSGSDISIPRGQRMENPIHVRFTISDSAPVCTARFKVEVKEDGSAYRTDYMDVQIEAK